jgi:hypothetical protein
MLVLNSKHLSWSDLILTGPKYDSHMSSKSEATDTVHTVRLGHLCAAQICLEHLGISTNIPHSKRLFLTFMFSTESLCFCRRNVRFNL